LTAFDPNDEKYERHKNEFPHAQSDIIGNQSVVESLKLWLTNYSVPTTDSVRVLVGPPGIGKRTIAFWVCQYLGLMIHWYSKYNLEHNDWEKERDVLGQVIRNWGETQKHVLILSDWKEYNIHSRLEQWFGTIQDSIPVIIISDTPFRLHNTLKDRHKVLQCDYLNLEEQKMAIQRCLQLSQVGVGRHSWSKLSPRSQAKLSAGWMSKINTYARIRNHIRIWRLFGIPKQASSVYLGKEHYWNLVLRSMTASNPTQYRDQILDKGYQPEDTTDWLDDFRSKIFQWTHSQLHTRVDFITRFFTLMEVVYQFGRINAASPFCLDHWQIEDWLPLLVGDFLKTIHKPERYILGMKDQTPKKRSRSKKKAKQWFPKLREELTDPCEDPIIDARNKMNSTSSLFSLSSFLYSKPVPVRPGNKKPKW
jgi:hypothetical protein